ncbi:hypothetical protein CP960_01755 [Malaciobacter halophilus]|uniref:DUF7033 domain-containing protein n=1 Tax=Malaciobacter halophilus TaxID=197482 RepID=A0A2N1J5J8_9BACT|nr:polysaccharide deacetylase family protein [Malaciobacter halophilus]AXH09211.1 hypothetical protein AHALO_0826 [Malaciobacter halophilus]PKI81847.1 hypothetical protein CP960_01755 [Malaciobacter halophilus]
MIKITIPNNNICERKYILDIIFDEFLGLDFKVIQNDDCKNWIIELPNKQVLTIKDTFFNKYPKDLDYLKLENIPQKIEELDIFAASFFMLTRWEEYVNKARDSHNRFPATESLAYKQGFLDRPIVNEYLEEFKKNLLELDSNLQFKSRCYQTFLTHDIDYIQKYSNVNNCVREIAGDIIKRKSLLLAVKNLIRQVKVFLGVAKDPFDTFDYLMDVSEKVGIKTHFFFMGKGETEYDNHYDSSSIKIKSTISNIKNRGHNIGIHPTYNAYNDSMQLKNEKNELENNLNTKIVFGREHYLRFEVPTTWQIWEDNLMQWDSTCGYADKEGFRCGVCYEYSVFNILTREKLKLKEKPLIVMECTIIDKSKMKGDYKAEVLNRMNDLKEKCKQYNGDFVLLWHNCHLEDKEDRIVFEEVTSC